MYLNINDQFFCEVTCAPVVVAGVAIVSIDDEHLTDFLTLVPSVPIVIAFEKLLNKVILYSLLYEGMDTCALK